MRTTRPPPHNINYNNQNKLNKKENKSWKLTQQKQLF